MLGQILKSISVGLKRRWRLGLSQAFGVSGALWLITEIGTRVSKPMDTWLNNNGDIYVIIILLCSFLWFIVYSYEPRQISFQIPTTNSEILIKFGDIFQEKSDWLIGVNEFFDSSIGQVIASTSVHGQFIAKIFGGDQTVFRKAVDSSLAGNTSQQTERRIEPSKAYPVGTTAVIANGEHKAFLVAISKTDVETHKAGSTVPMIWDAMIGALHTVRVQGNGQPLAMPLIGNGLSSVNLEPQHLLRLLTLAIVDFGRKFSLPAQVTIVVTEGCFRQLDIREIKRDWQIR